MCGPIQSRIGLVEEGLTLWWGLANKQRRDAFGSKVLAEHLAVDIRQADYLTPGKPPPHAPEEAAGAAAGRR